MQNVAPHFSGCRGAAPRLGYNVLAMPYLLIPLLQILCVVHAVRTGRDRMWIYILLFLPGLGVLAYAFVEVLPGFWARGRRAGCKPGRSAASIRTRVAPPARRAGGRRTVDNRRLLAEALLAAGQFTEASERIANR